MPTRNVNLSEHYDHFIEDRIADGRFSNASEAVRAGLHLLEREEAEYQAKLAWLRGAAQDAIDQLDHGDGVAFASAAELSKHIDQIRDEVLGKGTASGGR